MSQSKHTPGPWIADRSDTGFGYEWIIRAANGPDAPREIAMVYAHCGPGNATPANARLMTAGPEMLAALKRQAENIARWLETGEAAGAEESKSIYEQILASIAKAEGSVHG